MKENRYSYTVMYYMGALVFIVVNVFLYAIHVLADNPADSTLSFVLDDIANDAAYFECVMIGTFIASILAEKHVPKRDMDYMIILGCGLRSDGTPMPLLQGRIDRALWFSERQKIKKNKDMVFVCSGGQGDDEIISEAAI